MIKNLLFDFGDIFIDLDKPSILKEFQKLESSVTAEDITGVNEIYEIGDLSTEDFIHEIKQYIPNATDEQIIDAWNSILKDFPVRRLEFLKAIVDSEEYKVFLLSNTNDLHIEWIEKNVPHFEEFKALFDQFYVTQEVGMRKPNPAIFQLMLDMNNIKAEETLFIDDTKENTDSAATLGYQVWNLIPGKEDVTELFITKKELF